MQADISDADVYVQGRRGLFADKHCSKHCYSPIVTHSSLQNHDFGENPSRYIPCRTAAVSLLVQDCLPLLSQK